MAADFVLIPVQPSPYDLWAAQETVGLIQEAMTYKPNLKAAFVMNRKSVNTAISKSARETLAELPFPVLTAEIAQRVVFAESAAVGQTVLEREPKGAAAREVGAFIKELERVAA